MVRTASRSAGGGGVVTITWDNRLGDNVQAGGAIFLSVLEMEMSAVAEEMQAFARANHPWQNQTGEAERTFTVTVMGRHTIVAKHGAPHGIWLEFKYGGRWGIIPKTLDYGKGRLTQAYAKAWTAAWRFA